MHQKMLRAVGGAIVFQLDFLVLKLIIWFRGFLKEWKGGSKWEEGTDNITILRPSIMKCGLMVELSRLKESH